MSIVFGKISHRAARYPESFDYVTIKKLTSGNSASPESVTQESEVTASVIRKAYEFAAEELRERIVREEWPVGTRLPSVEQLAKTLGVGRSTVREALTVLKTEGWVDVRHGGGTFVLSSSGSARQEAPPIVNMTQLLEWLELRYILETEGAALAAERRSKERLAELEAILGEMMSETEEEALERSDIRFHAAVARAAGNGLLARTLETLLQSIGPVMRESRKLWLFAEQSEAARLTEEHRSIVEAIKKGDPPLAKQRMASHLQKVEQTLRELQTRGS